MSPGQKRGMCDHMAVFDGHLKCARCRDKGVGDDLCVLKKACPICKAFTPEQIQQLCTPTYRDRKHKKVSASPTPTLVDPSQVSVLGRVDGEKAVVKSETPACKKKRSDDSPKPSSKKKSSCKPRSDKLEDLDEKWRERFARLEAMLLSGTSTSGLSSGVTDGGAGPSLAQTTSEAAFVSEAASRSTTHPDVSQQNATQCVEAAGAGTATQPVEAPGVGPELLLSGTGSAVQSGSEKIYRDSLALLMMTTFATAPQSKMIPVIKNSLRRLVTERPSEA